MRFCEARLACASKQSKPTDVGNWRSKAVKEHTLDSWSLYACIFDETPVSFELKQHHIAQPLSDFHAARYMGAVLVTMWNKNRASSISTFPTTRRAILVDSSEVWKKRVTSTNRARYVWYVKNSTEQTGNRYMYLFAPDRNISHVCSNKRRIAPLCMALQLSQ